MTNDLNILHVVPSLAAASGGPAYTVPALCKNLADIGVSVRILTVDVAQLNEKLGKTVGGDERKVPTKKTSCIGSVEKRMIWSPPFPFALANELVRTKIDVIHSHGIWRLENHFAVWAGKRAAVPVVITPRGMVTSWAINAKRRKKYLAWKFYQERDMKSATLFHCTAHAEVEDVRELGLTAPAAVIPNGVDMPNCVAKRVRKDSDQKKTVLFMSRVHPKKGVDKLIDAWKMVDATGWKCRIVGPGESDYKAHLSKKIEECGLKNDFQFVDMVRGAEKWRTYEDADLFVLPTNSENFGVVVAEALAAGLPVITTKAAPWRELAEHRCGWWVDMDTGAIASALRSAMALTDETRWNMGDRGRRLVSEKYSWKKIATDMLEVYRWICAHGERPKCVEL